MSPRQGGLRETPRGDLIPWFSPWAVLLVGPPGCGKTTLGMAFADELPGSLHHISSQKCDVAALDRLTDLLAHYASRGKFHVVLRDEADQMTEKAQLQLLRVRYLAPGQLDPDPKQWQFRKVSKKGSRGYVRCSAICL